MKKTLLYQPTSTVTRVFLVLLRLAIGWHLFIEGAAKLDSFSVGLTGSGKPFSSRGYLLQSQGPFAPYFRKLAGDPDELLLPLLDGAPGAVPAALEARWKDYVQRYVDHYRFDQALKDQANALLKKHLDGLAVWFAAGHERSQQRLSLRYRYSFAFHHGTHCRISRQVERTERQDQWLEPAL
ncbi:MAG: hypothetical protein QM703_07715 [Gemmatales bacterium]